MKTRIKTIHEEEYSDKSRTLGVLLNYDANPDYKDWKDSYLYIYREGMYIFFNTMIDMIDYLMYGEQKMKRAYMEEQEFDSYYDAPFIEGSFAEKLKWI